MTGARHVIRLGNNLISLMIQGLDQR